jgi:hypothetical protein
MGAGLGSTEPRAGWCTRHPYSVLDPGVLGHSCEVFRGRSHRPFVILSKAKNLFPSPRTRFAAFTPLHNASNPRQGCWLRRYRLAADRRAQSPCATTGVMHRRGGRNPDARDAGAVSRAWKIFFGVRFTKVCIGYLSTFTQIPRSKSGPGRFGTIHYRASAN